MSSLRQRLLTRLASVRPGATMCPGALARECGTTLAQARGDVLALAAEGKIALSQRGRAVAPNGLKGPFRVRLR